MQLDKGARSSPASRAPAIELHEGLDCRSLDGWPSVRFDFGRILDWTAPLWAAGFYNKTFIWPRWHTYEPVIRRLAGLGHAPQAPDPDRYDLRHLHCDVLVVGGGASGLRAALEAGRAGERVTLIEQDRTLGGRALWNGFPRETTQAEGELREISLQFARLPNVRLLTRTTAVAAYDHGVYALIERTDSGQTAPPRERYWIVRAKRVVLATGAIEQPLIFENNDRPGIMLASAARQYLRRYGVAPGRRVLIATNNDSAYTLARNLTDSGVAVLALADSRPAGAIPSGLRAMVRTLGIEWLHGSIPINTSGSSALKAVTVGALSNDPQGIAARRTFRCDALAVSGGFAPAVHLYAQAGGKLTYDETSGTLHPVPRVLETSREASSITIVGSATQAVRIGPRVSPVGNTRRQWVDLAHDVTVADLELSVRENYSSIEHVKRYTTVGMAADQGKTSHAATVEIVGRLRGVAPRNLGHTTLRPPVIPVTLGAIAGRDLGGQFAPMRQLPMHDWHASRGGIFHDFGTWQRPVAYPKPGETRERAALREARMVRTTCGLFDGSSLGKIEIQGPDALEFIDRFYINNLKTLQPGRARYGLMLRESGVLFDDGTVVALAPDHMLVTTTSGNAARVYHWLEEWHQCEWPDLRVAITPVTEQWAVLSLAGPHARTILSKLDTDIDFAPPAFPHLALRQGRLLDLPARIYRVSFTGELTYEINVPADSALRLWEALLETGAPHGLEPFGMDALMTLRLEKGFLHLGTDTDGTTIPDDVGWGHVAKNKTADYIGRRSLSLAEHVKPGRLQLVGLVPAGLPDTPGIKIAAAGGLATAGHSHGGAVRSLDLTSLSTSSTPIQATPAEPFIIGSHLRLADSAEVTDGWITSAGIATMTREPVALALLRGGRHRIGAEVAVCDDGKTIGSAKVVSPPFFDPNGERMNG